MKWIIIPGLIFTYIVLGIISYIVISNITDHDWREEIKDQDYAWVTFVFGWPILDVCLGFFGIFSLLHKLLEKIAEDTRK